MMNEWMNEWHERHDCMGMNESNAIIVKDWMTMNKWMN